MQTQSSSGSHETGQLRKTLFEAHCEPLIPFEFIDGLPPVHPGADLGFVDLGFHM